MMLRTTRFAIGTMTEELRALRDENPRAFLEFVGIARDRNRVPIGDNAIRYLRKKGWIEPTEKRGGWTAHDMMRDIVQLHVKGNGIELSISDTERGTPHIHLPNGQVADKAMVDALALDFERLYQVDPIAWAELVRMTRGYQKKPFGNTLQALEDLSYVVVQQGQFNLPMNMGVMGMSSILIPRYVLELLPHCATDGTGLNFHPKKPYDYVCGNVPASEVESVMESLIFGTSPFGLLMMPNTQSAGELTLADIADQLNDAFGKFPSRPATSEVQQSGRHNGQKQTGDKVH